MHSLILHKLYLRNFLSFGNNITTINLNPGKAVLVVGRNLDSTVDGQVDSNGAGKTTILEGILTACYGKTISGKSATTLVNNINGKNMETALELHRNGGQYDGWYKFERVKKCSAKGGDQIYLLKKPIEADAFEAPYEARKEAKKNKTDITNDSVSNAGKEMEKILGMPFEIFSRIVIISATHHPFLDLGLDKQRAIIEELFGFTELSEKADVLKEVIRNNNTNLNTLKKVDEQIKQEIERFNTQLDSATRKLNEWDGIQAKNLSNLKAEIKEYDSKYGDVDFDAEEAKFQEIETLTSSIDKLTTDINTVSTTYNRTSTQKHHALNWDRTHGKTLETLKAKIAEPLIFSNQTEIKIFNKVLDKFTESKNEITSELKFINSKLTTLQQQAKFIATNKSTSEKQLVAFAKEIEKLDHELLHIKDSKCPYCSQEYITSQDKLVTVEKEKDNVLKKIIDTKTSIETHNTEIESVNTNIENLNKTISQLNNSFERTKSEQEQFIIETLGSNDIDIEAEYQKTANRQALITELEVKEKETNPFLTDTDYSVLAEEIKALLDTINELKSKKDELTNAREILKKSLRFASVKDITTTKLRLDVLLDNYEKSKTWVNPHLDTVKSLQDSPPSELKTEKIQELHDLIEHQEFLLKLLTKKDSYIRKALVNRYIPFLNTRIKYYLEKIGLPHKVEFQQDMTVKITQFKSELPFTSLSSGQRARVNLALSFAFRDVLQSRFGSINFCILDECLDTGLGNVGVQLAAKMIKAIAKENNLSMFVISHRDEIVSMFDSKIVVELKNGFSSIVHSDI